MKPRHVAQAALWFGFGQREFNDGLYGNLPDRFDDVIGAADQSSTVADQKVAACGACIKGVTGNGEDVTRLIKRVAGVIRLPDFAAASTTTVVRARPGMIRLRAGKCLAWGCTPIGISEMRKPVLAMSCASVLFSIG